MGKKCWTQKRVETSKTKLLYVNRVTKDRMLHTNRLSSQRIIGALFGNCTISCCVKFRPTLFQLLCNKNRLNATCEACMNVFVVAQGSYLLIASCTASLEMHPQI
jgi:hypothetical protein